MKSESVEQIAVDWLNESMSGVLFEGLETCNVIEMARDLSRIVGTKINDGMIRSKLPSDIKGLLQSAVQIRLLRGFEFIDVMEPHELCHLEAMSALRNADRTVRRIFQDSADLKESRRISHRNSQKEYPYWYWHYVGKDSAGLKPSARWLEKRAEYYARAFEDVSPFCMHCEIADVLHIHHMTYRSVGFEDPCHLVALCEQCHADAHATNRKLKPPESCPRPLVKVLAAEGIHIQ